MPQTLNLSAALGASKTGQAVGYRLLNLNGTTQAAFTTTNVVETSVPGTYVVTVGVSVADAGARVVWGISGTDYTEGIIDPVPAVNLAANAITAAVIATDAIDGDAIAANAVTELQNGLATAAALTTVGNNVAAILNDTEVTGVVVAAASKTGYELSATGVSAIWANATRSLTTFGTLAADVWAVATRTITGGTVGSVTGSVGSVTGAVTVGTNNDKTNYTLSAAGITAIWAALTSGLTTVGSIGKLLVDNVNATISSRSTLTANDVWTNATRTLTSFGTLASDVWANATRTITGGTVTTVGDKTGYSLSSGGVLAIWDVLTSLLTTAGSVGKRIVDNLDATVSSRLASASYTVPPTAVQIDTQLSATHGAGSWATATGFATPANVTNAQSAILAAIDAVPTAAEIDQQLSNTHGSGGWGAAGLDTVLDAIESLNVIPLAAVERPYIVNDLTIVRASTFEALLSVPTIPPDWTSARLTVKEPDQEIEADSTAVLQILVSNPGAVGDGLVVLNGATATASQASLTVDTVLGRITVRIEDDSTAMLYPSNYPYDIKFYHGVSESGLPYEGRVRVLALPTQTV